MMIIFIYAHPREWNATDDLMFHSSDQIWHHCCLYDNNKHEKCQHTRQGCTFNRNSIEIATWPTAIFESQGGEIFVLSENCVKIQSNSNTAKLQGCDLHFIFYRLKTTSLFGADPCKDHHNHFDTFIREKENNDVKKIIPSSIANHITVTISLHIIAIRYFLKILQP